VVYQIAYISSSRTLLDEAQLLDILTLSRRNNSRDGISGILMYHDQLFFHTLEGERTRTNKCFARILCDPRHSAISLMWEGEAENRAFASYAMGYAGPDKIGFNIDYRLKSLADLLEGKNATLNNDDLALQMALQIFRSFSGVEKFGQSVPTIKPLAEKRTICGIVSPSTMRLSSLS
jgi:hypothetical protein